VPSWFQKVLAAELNYLADKKKVQLINAAVYLLIVKKDLEPKRAVSVLVFMSMHMS
jgi:hypothetical protein